MDRKILSAGRVSNGRATFEVRSDGYIQIDSIGVNGQPRTFLLPFWEFELLTSLADMSDLWQMVDEVKRATL